MKDLDILIYTHTNSSFIYDALIGQMNKHVDDSIDIHICYNENAKKEIVDKFPDKWIKHVYDDKLIYTDNLCHILNEIDKKYVLFVHDDQIPVGDIKPDILNKMIDFMDIEKCNFLMSYQCETGLYFESGSVIITDIFKSTGFDDYNFYPLKHHLMQPAIWNSSLFKEFCKKFKKSHDLYKGSCESKECLEFTSTKNCWCVQNSKTFNSLRTINSLFYPHMHSIAIGKWTIMKYKGTDEIKSLKDIIESYDININDRGIDTQWQIHYQ